MPENRPTLFLGSRDAALEDLVEALRENGFWTEDVPDSYTPALERAVRNFQSTHVDANHEHLTADGVVGPRTWWALQNASGPAQSSQDLTLTIPSGLPPLRKKILEVALAEYAKKVVEVPNGRNRGPLVDRYLPAWAIKPNERGPAWCCFFYSWVMKEALGKWPLGRLEGGCLRARQRAVDLGLWIPNSRPNLPNPGDSFLIDHGDGTGHTGIVVRISEDGRKLNTVEGNLGNRVDVGLRDARNSSIAGFINNVPSESDPAFERGVLAVQGLLGVSVA